MRQVGSAPFPLAEKTRHFFTISICFIAHLCYRLSGCYSSLLIEMNKNAIFYNIKR